MVTQTRPTAGCCTLQEAYDANTSTPQITLDATAGMTIDQNPSPTDDNIFRVRDSGDVDVFEVRGNLIDLGTDAPFRASGAAEMIRVGNATGDVLEFFASGTRTFNADFGTLISLNSELVLDQVDPSFRGVDFAAVIRHKLNPGGGPQGRSFRAGNAYINDSATVVNHAEIEAFVDESAVWADTQTITANQVASFASRTQFRRTGGGVLSVSSFKNFEAGGSDAGDVTTTTRTGFHVDDWFGAGSLANQIGLNVVDMNKGTSSNIAIAIDQGAGNQGDRSIASTGVAISTFAGPVQIDQDVSLRLGRFGDTQVRLSNPLGGILRMIGNGGTNNEGLDWDLETTANSIKVDSTTGAGLQIANGFVSIGTESAVSTNKAAFTVKHAARTLSNATAAFNSHFASNASHTATAAVSSLSTVSIDQPVASLGGGGSITDCANLIVAGDTAIGTNRYGLLITADPSGGTINNPLRVANGNARFDGEIDLRTFDNPAGGAAATLANIGTVAGAGPTNSAVQARWIRFKLFGTDHWFPAWR
tara:strand:- start:25926 stop:27524 length:1599 start_codon:yes stop_codon:yes gene_type:complete